MIQTTGFRDDLWIDMSGAPMTSAAKMTERLSRPNYGTLEVEITVKDPKVYTSRPWRSVNFLTAGRLLAIPLAD